MIEKQHDVGSPAAMVTFRLPPELAATRATVVGEFNGWSRDSHVMAPDGGGLLTITVPLQVGRGYRFRYLLEGEQWENDWAADAYWPNEFGGNDSVVDLTDLGAPGGAATNGNGQKPAAAPAAGEAPTPAPVPAKAKRRRSAAQ
jgi:hypothetical protein